jgi:hypothetical protein
MKFKLISLLFSFYIPFVEAHTTKPLNALWFKSQDKYVTLSGDELYQVLEQSFAGNAYLRGTHAYKYDFKIIGFGRLGCVLNLKKSTPEGHYALEMVNMDNSVERKSYQFKWNKAEMVKLNKYRIKTGIDTYDNVYEIMRTGGLFQANSGVVKQREFIYYNNDARKLIGFAVQIDEKTQVQCEVK